MRVLAITHGADVRPELFGDVILESGHELVEWEIGSGPRPGGTFAALLVLGGAQNVGEEDRFPWLEDEYELLREAVREGTPLFAICLGAQTLAHALGGRVARLPAQQTGFVTAELTAAGAGDPVLGVLPESFPALVGNHYGFELPPGATLLATSSATPQAYRVGESAWAVQFHPEARLGQVVNWFREEEATLPVPLAEIEAQIAAGIAEWGRLGTALCKTFLAEAERATR